MSTLKSRLKNIPDEIFDEIEQLLANYGMEDCEVTGIDITTKDQPSVMNVTEKECEEQGKKRKCKKRKNAPDYCWCAKR